MNKQRERDEIMRYDQLYLASYPGREPIIVSALNSLQAVEKAAAKFGITREEQLDKGRIREPTLEECTDYCWESGSTIAMKVITEYGTAKVNAVCRVDALRQAAGLLKVKIPQINTIKTRVYAIRHEEEERHDIGSNYSFCSAGRHGRSGRKRGRHQQH